MVWGKQVKRLLNLLFLGDSRKVGFGLQIFIVSGVFLAVGKITAGDWLTCVFLSSGLIGGGTLGDRWLEIKNKETPTAPPSSR